jgi:predicted RNA-binding protein associated with RNAse of E/G family
MGATPPSDVPLDEPDRRAPGDVVAIREIWQGRIWEARPAVVVRDEPNLTMLHVPPRVHCRIPADDDGRELRLPTESWNLIDVARSDRWNLSFAFPDTPYAVILGFDERSRFDLYYVNLQSPLRRSTAGYDLVEYVLDVTIPPDRSTWSWKDEDELAEAIERGLFTDEDAEWFRHWGERAVEHVLLREPPFDEDWEGWRPDPAWEDVELPGVWDAAPV